MSVSLARAKAWRLVFGAVLAIAGMWLSGAVTFSMVQAADAPDDALVAWPTSLAQSGVAAHLVEDQANRGRVALAAVLARAALARSPVNVEAVRTLALAEAAGGRIYRARVLFRYAEQLSRRDVPTQLWLIEDRVAAGDVTSALVHYNRAMQSSPASRDLLSPILAQAADDPAINRPLARILRTRPEWWSNFLGDFVAHTRSPDALATVTRSLHLDPAISIERDRLSTILQRYVDLDQGATGRRLFNQLTGSPPDLVTDGGFERDAAIPPFGWQLTENGASAGVRETRDGARGAALTLDGNEGQEVARQLLVLAPGRYALRLTAGSVTPGFSSPPTVAIQCLAADAPLAEADVPLARPVATLRLAFNVPVGCATQALIVRTARATGDSDDKPWIDDVAIAPLRETLGG